MIVYFYIGFYPNTNVNIIIPTVLLFFMYTCIWIFHLKAKIYRLNSSNSMCITLDSALVFNSFTGLNFFKINNCVYNFRNYFLGVLIGSNWTNVLTVAYTVLVFLCTVNSIFLLKLLSILINDFLIYWDYKKATDGIKLELNKEQHNLWPISKFHLSVLKNVDNTIRWLNLLKLCKKYINMVNSLIIEIKFM